MSTLDLLSLTYRKNSLEPEFQSAVQTRLESFVASNISTGDNIFSGDVVALNGKVMDIMGSLTDEQVESVMKVGIDKTVDKMVEIITTCNNISDSELINMCLAGNPAGAPKRLRIVRTKAQVRPDNPDNPNNPINPDNPDNPINPDNPDNPINPDNPDNPINPDNPDNPTDPDPTPNNPVTDENTDITLTRKGDNYKSKTIAAGEEIKVKLTGTFDRNDYYYTISNTGSTGTSVTFELQDNDRFIIRGNNLQITANEGQEDNLIIMGTDNSIYTNSGNDIIRIGGTIDSGDALASNPYTYTNNQVFAGGGNDYILVDGCYTKVDGGSGTDTITYGQRKISEMEQNAGCTKSNVEYTFSALELNTQTFSNTVEGGNQIGYGDCKFLSFINSLNNQGKLGEYIYISKSGNTYTVEFTKSGYNATIQLSELTTDEKAAGGDIDFVLIEAAFKKIINRYGGYNIEDTSDDKSLGTSKNNWLISKFIYGQENGGTIFAGGPYGYNTSSDANIFKNDFSILLQAYLNKSISHLVIGAGVTNLSIGIHDRHAYAVKGGKVGEYIIISNPWDGNDTIKLDWNDFIKYFDTIELFGDSYEIAVNNSDIRNVIYCNRTEYDVLRMAANSASETDGDNNSKPLLLHTNLLSENTDVNDEIEEISCCINELKKVLCEEKTFDYSF